VRRDAQGLCAGLFGRSRAALAFLGALALVIAVSLGAAPAIADEPPAVTIDNSVTAEYTRAEMSGTVNPSGGPSTTYWHFEYTTTPDDESSWQGGPGGEIAGPDAEGTSPVPVSGTIENLQPQTEYSVRLVAENGDFANRVATEAPYPTFTTKGPVGKPAVTVDPVTTFDDTTAHFSGTINPEAGGETDPGFNVNWHFECSPGCPNGQLGGQIAADGSDHTVEGDATGLEPNTEYLVELVASNAGGSERAGPQSFTTTAVAPSVETVPAFALQGGASALLGARINPGNSATTYRIEYGATTAYGQTLSGDAGSSGQLQVFSQKATGLTPGSTYHFRAVAENPAGEATGRDMTFETAPAGSAIRQDCPNAQLREENRSSELPDCRAYEMVSPPDKNGNDVGIGPDVPTATFAVYVGAADGDALAFETSGALPGAQSNTLVNENLSTRTAAGWMTEPISPAQPPSPRADYSNFQYFTPNLDAAAVFTPKNVNLVAGAAPESPNLYLRDNETGSYTILTASETAIGADAGYAVGGASDDLSHVVFDSNKALTPEAPHIEPNYNTYEWVDGELRLVTILPNGQPAPAGGNLASTLTYPVFNLISHDGSRVFFTTGGELEERQLYVRENGERTVLASPSVRTIPDPNPVNPKFWGASGDGDHVFFTSGKALTDDAQPGDIALYRFNIDDETLENVTPSPETGRTVVVDGVAGMSDDASYVYFVSQSKLVPGEGAWEEPNLYLWHDGEVRFIAPTSVGLLEDLHGTARVSLTGRYLAFESRSQLTAYDNTDAASGERDAEVYRYDALTDRLVCASCNPTGARPIGSARMNESPSRQLHYKQRAVTENGRVFFSTMDALVADDVNGLQDAYAFQSGRTNLISTGTSADFSKFVDASSDGDDVFLVTRQQLVPADRDENLDVYDARVGGGFPQTGTAGRACDGDECQGQASSGPSAATSGSAALSPHPKPALRKRKLARALRACRSRHEGKKKRRHCERKAKKRFAGSSDSRGKK
jgi:hypothetical protein